MSNTPLPKRPSKKSDVYTEAELKLLQAKEKKMRQAQDEFKLLLPHLYEGKLYKWQRDFYESRKHLTLLVASNQVGKSSIQIKKNIHWATATHLWPSLWPTKPKLFWYFYPDQDTWQQEFETKWVPLLPKGKLEGHAQYGWKPIKQNGQFKGIQFNSGVYLAAKSYSQRVTHLQAGTVYYVSADEELPVDYYDELALRLANPMVNGYFSMAFTATLNQELWRMTLEPPRPELERFPDACKLQVSMYDCLHFEDGTDSAWTEEKIAAIKATCKSEEEIQRRVYGKFVAESGRIFHKFNIDKHMVAPHKLEIGQWSVYTGIDIGSGGKTAHPAAIAFVAVRSDYKKGFVVTGWRGDGVETTSIDILGRLLVLNNSTELPILMHSYDFQSRDFGIIATRAGVSVVPANKKRDEGIDLMNSLFEKNILKIFDVDELVGLGSELMTVMKHTDKSKAKDDFCDAVRYAIANIPWNMEGFKDDDQPLPKIVQKERRHGRWTEENYDFGEKSETTWEDYTKEVDAINELSGTS